MLAKSNTRAGLLVLVTNTKQIAANVKQNALSLIIGLLQVPAAALETIESCPGICYGKDKKYHETCLQVDATVLCKIYTPC